MSDAPESAPLDLARFTEGLRRRLYDRVVRIQFSPSDSGFPYTPDEAGLQVVCLFGRWWFALWTDPEEPPAVPAYLRTQIVRIIQASPDDPEEIVLSAV